MTIDQARYRQVMGHLPTGVVVVAAPGPVGTAIGSFAALSLDPPLVTFSITRTSSTWPQIRDARVFCVSVLAEDQEHVSRQFAQSGGDKFAGLGYSATESGSPRLDGCVAWIDCDVASVLEGGDHHIVVGAVRDMAVDSELRPLVFYRGGYGL